jgi:hypothetical protein
MTKQKESLTSTDGDVAKISTWSFHSKWSEWVDLKSLFHYAGAAKSLKEKKVGARN